ncbi:MAG: serine/threonine-protein phosphatase [Myxococcales bacterium]|nr:serine/threonine-protein phosphatase [Myxococcales bacterium]
MDALLAQIQQTILRVADGRLTAEEGSEVLVRLMEGESHHGQQTAWLVSEQYTSIAQSVGNVVAQISEFTERPSEAPEDGEAQPRSDEETELLLAAVRERLASHLAEAPETPQGSLAMSRAVRTLQRNLADLGQAVQDLSVATLRDAHERHDSGLVSAVDKVLASGRARPATRACRMGSFSERAVPFGGDWWSLTALSGDSAAVLLADSGGAGADAAVVASAARAAAHAFILGTREQLHPDMLLNLLNRVLFDVGVGSLGMTGVALRLDSAGRLLEVSNAGHLPPYVLRSSGPQLLLAEAQPPLGTLRAQKLRMQRTQLRPGDVCVLFTDGVIEATDPDGRAFGEGRLRSLCMELRAEGPQSICDGVAEALASPRAGRPPIDDATLLAVEIP